jgi:hypothetical protein
MAVRIDNQKPNPAVRALLLVVIPLVTLGILYAGMPGTAFNGVRAGVFFGMRFNFNNGFNGQGAGRIMDSTIKCTSAEAQEFVRGKLRTFDGGRYPADSFSIEIEAYPAGYRYRYSCQTWYAQKLFTGGRLFRKGAQVGDEALDAEVGAKHEALTRAIEAAIDGYFRSKGAH